MRVAVFLFLCSLLFVPQWVKRDFKPPPPHPEIAFNPAWEVPPPSLEILEILEQPFTYLARGNQTTVFESRDRRYVLKFFRYSRPRFSLLDRMKSLAASLQGKTPKYDRFTKAEKTFTAAHIAYTKAAPFTQVLFCHLNLTQNLLPTAQLRAHRLYRLPLDRCRFVLQRKVIPFPEALLSARERPQEMQQRIDSLLALIERRTALGISNSDPNLAPNFGFLDGQAVEIDFGNYRELPLSPEEQAAEVDKYRTRLREWLQRHVPEWVK